MHVVIHSVCKQRLQISGCPEVTRDLLVFSVTLLKEVGANGRLRWNNKAVLCKLDSKLKYAHLGVWMGSISSGASD